MSQTIGKNANTKKVQGVPKLIPQKYSGFIKEIQQYDSKIGYIILLTLGFFVYTLSYVFLYGYYFGGKSRSIMSVLDVIINPVPFNFKSLLILGGYLIIILFIFISIIIKMSSNLTSKSGQIIFDGILLLLAVFFTVMTLVVVFVGKVEFNEIYMKLSGYIYFITIFGALAHSGKLVEMIYGFFGTFVSSVILLFISFILKIELSVTFLFYTYLYTFTLMTVMLVFFNVKKSIIYINIFLAIYTIASELKKFSIMSWSSLFSILFIISLLIGISAISKKIESKSNNGQNKKTSSKKKYFLKYIETGLSRNKYIILSIVAVSFIVYMYYLIFVFGQDMGKRISGMYVNESIFYIGDNAEPVVGNIVSHKDDIFYISSKDRELIIVKSTEAKSAIKKKE